MSEKCLEQHPYKYSFYMGGTHIKPVNVTESNQDKNTFQKLDMFSSHKMCILSLQYIFNKSIVLTNEV